MWQPITYQCRDCGAFISSKTPGHWSCCTCPDDDLIYIDQTKDYIRLGGRSDKFIYIPLPEE